LGEHSSGLLVGKVDLVDGVTAVLERHVVVVDVGWDEDLWVPGEALAIRQVGDQTRRTLRIANINDGALLLRDGRTQEAGPPPMTLARTLALGGPRWRRWGLGVR
jgi:hypothetical protein